MDAAKTGGYLAMLRKTKGLTQQEAAEQLGVSNKTVSKWESGGGFPDITVLPALAELYGVTADDILAGESLKRAQTGNGGLTEVQKYLNRRDEFRFRLGAALAMVCAMAAVWYWGNRALGPLLMAASLLYLRVPKWQILISTIVIIGLVYGAFTMFLGVKLPVGLLFK